jgi:3',5'-cyclic AMP phosphodiesterase CpdA
MRAQPLFQITMMLRGMILLTALRSMAAEPIIVRSLAHLSKTPPASSEAFDFVVTGDTHSNRQLVYQTDIIKQMIREWNLLRPAFAIEVGDLILGGSANNVPPQWDLFEKTIAECRVPYFSAPGNHDISDAFSERLWNERMGPTYYAFSYGNTRFIVLNTEEVDALDKISDAQCSWLKQQLEAANAKNILVLMHQPYFASYEDPGKIDEVWAKRWKPMADLFRGHPVRAVFAGHEHGYRDFGVRDGVHYVICAGGARFSGGGLSEGQFNHYLWVRVRGDIVSWVVIQPGSVLASDVFTNDRATELHAIRHQWVSCDEVAVPIGQTIDHTVTVRVANPSETPFSSSITWTVPRSWKVAPLSKDYTVKGKSTVDLQFQVRTSAEQSLRFPVPSFKTHYANTRFGEPVEVTIPLPYVPIAEAIRARKPVDLDGSLGEWNDTQPIALTSVSGFETGHYDPSDLSGECRAMWDEQNLYLAFDITDNDHCQPYAGDIVWLADAIEFGVNRWAWGFSLTQHGPEVFSYVGEGLSAETVNKDVQLAVRRTAGHTLYEAAIPARLNKPLAFQKGASFQFRVLVADRDNSDARHELSLTPGEEEDGGIRIVLTQ